MSGALRGHDEHEHGEVPTRGGIGMLFLGTMEVTSVLCWVDSRTRPLV